MTDFERIVQTYHNADAEQRLSLFLTYRDFRKHFMAIELAETPITANHSMPASPKTPLWGCSWLKTVNCRSLIWRCLAGM